MKNSCQDDLAIAILKERLRQARCSFDRALFGLVACGVMEICGFGLSNDCLIWYNTISCCHR
jgi:hypothetical protein